MGSRIAIILLVSTALGACSKPETGAGLEHELRAAKAAEHDTVDEFEARAASLYETLGAIEARAQEMQALAREYEALTPEQKEARAPEFRRALESMKARHDRDAAAFRAGQKDHQ
jgi:hypothetical protein